MDAGVWLPQGGYRARAGSAESGRARTPCFRRMSQRAERSGFVFSPSRIKKAHVSVAKGEATCEGQNVDLARRVGIVKVDVEPHALRFGIQDLRGPAAAVRGARRLVLVLEKGSAQGPKLALVRTSKE